MSELPNIFEGAKVGDEVFTIQKGWCFMQDIDFGHEDNDPFPLLIGGEWYTIRGTIHSWDRLPSAWPAHLVPQYYLDLCPRPKKKVKKVIEIWANIYPENKIAIHKSECLADKKADKMSIACVKLTVEYEVEE